MREGFRLLILVSLLGGLVHAAGDEGNPLRDLERARTAEARIEVIPRVVALRSEPAAKALLRLVRRDPSPEVRAIAARGLGRMPTEGAYRRLARLVTEGGTPAVREAVARGLAFREESLSMLVATLGHSRTTAPARGLILRALGRFHDEASRGVLVSTAKGADPHLRGEALRALASREDGRKALPPLLTALLARPRDDLGVRQALAVVAELEDASLIPALVRHEASRNPLVRAAAKHELARLRHVEAAARARAGAKDGYGVRVPPPPPPDGRTFGDVVIVLDVTGSTVVVLPRLKERIRLEIERLRAATTDLRIGIVGYRFWKHVSRKTPRREVLPLTYDLALADAFLESLESQGPDSQGADVSGGLSEALDRMGWRPGSRRNVILVADGKCHDPAAARRVVDVHHRADGARTRVLFALSGRAKVPPELAELARLGGSGSVSPIR